MKPSAAALPERLPIRTSAPGVRRLDDLVAAEVHRDVAGPVDLRLEEDEVSRLELRGAQLP